MQAILAAAPGIINTVCQSIASVSGSAKNVFGGVSDLIRAIKGHGIEKYGWLHPNDDGEIDSSVDLIGLYVDAYWPNASEEERQEYYNAVKHGVESAQIFLQHSQKNDIQMRILQLSAESEVTGKPDEFSYVFVNQLSSFYRKAQDLFHQSTNLVYVGSVINIRNTSNENGNALNVSLAMKTSNPSNLTDPESYDDAANNIAVYNKEAYTKFLPASQCTYDTESLSRIISDYTQDPRWEGKKNEVYENLAKIMKLTPMELKTSGSSLRCISGNGTVNYEGILDFKSFKEKSCGFEVKKGFSYPGTSATMFDTYVKMSTIAEKTPFSFIVYGLFLMDKTVNDNINANLSEIVDVDVEPSNNQGMRRNDEDKDDKDDNDNKDEDDNENGEDDEDDEEDDEDFDEEYKYVMAPMNKSEVEQVIEEVLNDSPNVDQVVSKLRARAYKRMGVSFVMKNGRFLKEYKEGMKLKKGEKLHVKKGGLLIPK